MSSSSALRVQQVSKLYRTGRTGGLYRYRSLREELVGKLERRSAADEEQLVWALRDASFTVEQGEAVGIIGRNGAGKSTLFKVLSKVTPPTSGRVEVHGRLGALLEVGTGFHPELTGRENVWLSGAILGMRRHEIQRRMDEIIEFSGIARFLDTPVKRYSSGMYLRLAFSVAAHLEPDVLLVDEVLAVGDADFQRKCLGKMAEVGASGRTVLFVSHSMPAISRLCSRVLLLDGGRLVADGSSAEVIKTYLEPGAAVTSADRQWEDAAHAPGDDIARLHRVRVLDDHGGASDEHDIRRPISVEIEYWRLTSDPDRRLTASFLVTNEEGAQLFVSADHVNRPAWEHPPPAGLIRSTCTIPGNFLAEGWHFVMAAITSLAPTPVIHAREDDAVAFHVADRSEGDGARGDYGADWPGLVRPMLDWRVEHHVPLQTEQSPQ